MKRTDSVEFVAHTVAFLKLFKTASPPKKELLGRAHVAFSDRFKAFSATGVPDGEILRQVVDRVDILTRRAIRLHTHDGGNVSCRRRCSHCCHIEVSASAAEVSAAMKAARRAKLNIDAERLREQVQAQRDGEWRALPLESRRCVFLTRAGDCGVYEARPLACRKYIVASPPERCDTGSQYGQEVQVLTNDEAETLSSAVADVLPLEPMPAAILAHIEGAAARR